MKANAYTLMRLSQAPDLAALRRVWESLSDEQRSDSKVIAYKDLHKEALSK